MCFQRSLLEARRRPLRHGRSRAASIPRWVACAILILSAIACNFTGTTGPEQPAGPVLALPPAWTPTVAGAAPFTATVESAPATAQSTPISGDGSVALPQDVCDLIPVERVQTVVGEPVAQTSPAGNTCVHVLASGTSLTAVILRGDAARRGFIDPIAQLSTQEGCTLSYSFSGELGEPTPEPTPLPAEVEALVAGRSLIELAQVYLESIAAHCDAPLETVPGYGELAFIQSLDLIVVETASLGVVIGDAYVTFTLAVADPQADSEAAVLQLSQAQGWLKSLAQPVLAPIP